MTSILSRRDIFKIASAIVVLIAILVIDLQAFGHRANESKRDEPVNPKVFDRFAIAQTDHKISVYVYRAKDVASAAATMRTVAPYPSEIRNAVDALEARSVAPLFAEQFGCGKLAISHAACAPFTSGMVRAVHDASTSGRLDYYSTPFSKLPEKAALFALVPQAVTTAERIDDTGALEQPPIKPNGAAMPS